MHNIRSNKHLLAIPVYNEDRHVARVIAQAKQHIRHILVVDDGSTDATPTVLDTIPGLRVIRHPRNLGYGRALRGAFEHAASAGYDWLITMDCDEQHEPSAIPKFMTAAANEGADIISGSRYLHPVADPYEPPPDRREINGRITRLLNRRLGLRLTDAFCGFKAYRVPALQQLRITVPGYAMPLQFWVQAVRAGMRIVELPVRLIYNDSARRFGAALDNPPTRYAYYLRVLKTELAARAVTATDKTAPVCLTC